MIYAPTERNLVGRGPGTLTTTSEDALFPEANLFDNIPAKPFRFTSAAADVIMKKDINALTNPGFETSTLSGWTSGNTGTGTSTETTTAGEFRSGAKACEMTGTNSSNYGARYQEITVYAGEAWKLDAWARAIGSGTARIYIQNRSTGKYLTTGSAWQSASTWAATTSSTSYTNLTNTFTIESFEAAQQDEMTLRITLYCEAGNVAFDDCLMLPGVNMTAVAGHNCGPISPVLASSDDDSAYTTRLSPTLRRPTFYSSESTTRYHRYWRLTYTGTNLSPIYVGEWFLGRGVSPSAAQEYGWTTNWSYRQVRHETAGGETYRYGISPEPVRTYELTIQSTSDTERQEVINDMFRVTRGGEMPLLLVPYDGEPEVVIGLLDTELSSSRETLLVSGADLTLVELPLPVVGL
ncbi:MAG TPA: carbohydrate binding domain-containing protein [Steroidobacteraceae bacterium]|nr:carbohydrate binding domain-containing protein [Steroidobacteraceae bacterium]